MHKYIIILIALILTGCVTNPYREYYTDHTGGMGVLNNPIFANPQKDPTIMRGGDPHDDWKNMTRNGYIIIGQSDFNIASASDSDAIIHARNIGADIVLLYINYTDTQSGSMPLTLPDNRTSSSYGSATAFGPAGSATVFGSSYTTTYGTRTTYIPYNIRRYDYHASFWARANPPAFGAKFDDLSDAQRQQIQSNKGAAILTVVNGSPAFQSDILDGDIIRNINGVDVTNALHCVDIICQNRGKTISLSIFRNGETIQKEVQLRE
jgi:hypothetical protein